MIAFPLSHAVLPFSWLNRQAQKMGIRYSRKLPARGEIRPKYAKNQGKKSFGLNSTIC